MNHAIMLLGTSQFLTTSGLAIDFTSDVSKADRFATGKQAQIRLNDLWSYWNFGSGTESHLIDRCYVTTIEDGAQ